MENNGLQDIWKSIDSGINLISKEELGNILKIKVMKTMNNFYYIIGLSAMTSVGFIIFLFITASNRNGDILYQMNNLFVGLITVVSLISSIWSWRKLQNNRSNLPLKEWLDTRIILLSKWVSGKLTYYIIPVILIPTILSIHVYYEYKPFLEVLQSEESIVQLAIGLPIGGLVSYFTINRIRKSYRKNLDYLKNLYTRLNSTR